jgi:hypothetical protein
METALSKGLQARREGRGKRFGSRHWHKLANGICEDLQNKVAELSGSGADTKDVVPIN